MPAPVRLWAPGQCSLHRLLAYAMRCCLIALCFLPTSAAFQALVAHPRRNAFVRVAMKIDGEVDVSKMTGALDQISEIHVLRLPTTYIPEIDIPLLRHGMSQIHLGRRHLLSTS